jgi:hypothetical protein
MSNPNSTMKFIVSSSVWGPERDYFMLIGKSELQRARMRS